MDDARGKWEQMLARDPGHSQRYIQRFKDMAARGADLVGEARLIDALAPRGARILDAGCGPGRHAGYLHDAGHTVVGIDLDPALLEAAEADAPGPLYGQADLASDFSLPDGSPDAFDLILCAGNVITFLHPSTRAGAIARLAALLAPTGRLVLGFGAGRGYEFAEFLADATAAGLALDSGYSTWDLRPFAADSDFLVALLSRAA